MSAAALTGCSLRIFDDPPGPDTSEFRVRDFGAVADGIADDGPALRRAIIAAQAAGPGATVRLGPGRYRVGNADASDYALPIAGAERLDIVGSDATLVVMEPGIGCLRFTDATLCRVRGVSIDYDPPPYAETVVTAVQYSAGTFDVDVLPGSLDLDDPSLTFAEPGDPHPGTFGAVFDPRTRGLKDGLIDHVLVAAAERRSQRGFRLYARDAVLPAGLASGDIFVYLARQHGHAVACYRSPGISVEDVHVRAANAVAFALIQSSSARITGCTVGFAPGSQRLVTTNADGVHAQACRVGPTVEGCRFTGMMDDGLNVYVPPSVVVAIGGGPEVVVSGAVPVQVGDRLEFSDPVTGRVKGLRRVQSMLPAESGWLSLRLDRRLDGLVPAGAGSAGDHAFNLSASGEGYLIRNNVYERHRGHAMRLHTGKGVVEDNLIRHNSRDGILVSNDPDWPEGPHTRDLVIRGNTLQATGGDAAIDVEGRRLGYRLSGTPTQRNIRILDNTILDWEGSAIAVGAARDITLRDNVLIVTDDAAALAAERGILVERAGQVVIDGLVVRADATQPPTAAVEIAPTVADGDAGVHIEGLQVSRGVDAVRDRRVTDAADATAARLCRRSRPVQAVELANRAGPVG